MKFRSLFSLSVAIGAAVLAPLAGGAAPAVAPNLDSAVLSVQMKFDQLEFLRGEALMLSVRVANRSSAVFVADDYGPYVQNHLKLYVRDQATGRLLMPRPSSKGGRLLDHFSLKPGEEREFRVDARDVYDFLTPGPFHATAILTRGKETTMSRDVQFSIVDGLSVASAVRARSVLESKPLKFSLVYWERNRTQLLFLRIADAMNPLDVRGFVSLGAHIRTTDPTLTFGENDQLTVVQQITRDRFARTVVDYSQLPPTVVSREDNLLTVDALDQQLKAAAAQEAVDEYQRDHPDKKPGFFSRHKTRTPAAETSK